MMDLTVIRPCDQRWWDELDELTAAGFKPASNGLDEAAAERTACYRCGHHRMEYRGFTMSGVAHRSFALCDMCENWFEF